MYSSFLFILYCTFFSGWGRREGHCSFVCWYGWLVCWVDCNWYIRYLQLNILLWRIGNCLGWLVSKVSSKVFHLCADLFPFLFLFLSPSGSDESMLIVHALLEVAAHPEYDIASMTFNFWHNLQVNLTKRYPLEFTLFLLHFVQTKLWT